MSLQTTAENSHRGRFRRDVVVCSRHEQQRLEKPGSSTTMYNG